MTTPLGVLLITKIVITFFAVGLPFLVLGRERVAQLSGMDATPALYRLYAVAILALLVGYGGGLAQVLDETYPTGVIAMGVFSNAGAAITLLLTGQFKANTLNSLLTATFAAIAIGLVVMGLYPAWAMSTLA